MRNFTLLVGGYAVSQFSRHKVLHVVAPHALTLCGRRTRGMYRATLGPGARVCGRCQRRMHS